MKTCYFHIGFHKTATTTFQQICGKNRDTLAKAGIFYPEFVYPPEKGNRWNHSGPLSMIYKRGKAKASSKQSSQSGRTALRERNQKRQISALRQDHDLLFSGEALSCWPRENYLHFLDDLDTFGFKVKVLALVRPPYSFACSAIQETIKNGRFHPLIGLQQPHQRKRASMKALPSRSEEIKILQEVFGTDINFQPFSKALAHSDGPAAFCLEAFGLPVSWASLHHDSTFRSNESLNNPQVRAMNLINKEMHATNSRNRCRKSTFQTLRDGLNCLDGGRFLLTQSEFQFVQDQYNQIKQEMTDSLGTSFTDETLKFSDPIKKSNDIAESLARCAAHLATQPNNSSSLKTEKTDPLEKKS